MAFIKKDKVSEKASKVHPNFPDFFIAGAPKCGTTSLYVWLSRHPDLYMPVKEPGYFSQDIRKVPEKTLDDYLALFTGRDEEKRLIGESSPKYIYSAKGLMQISQYNPEAHIIVILRNPVDLVISYHGQMLSEGLEDVEDFAKAWELSAPRRVGNQLPRLCSWPKLLDYPQWGKLATAMRNVYQAFPREQVKVIMLDDMAENPRKTYVEVLEFLGMKDDGFADLRRENVRSEIKSLPLHRGLLTLRQWCYPLLSPLHRWRAGKGLGVLKWVNRFNTAPTGKKQSPISPEFRQELKTFYRTEVEELAVLIDRDLECWIR